MCKYNVKLIPTNIIITYLIDYILNLQLIGNKLVVNVPSFRGDCESLKMQR